jgi:hypothetical protein
MKKSVQILTVVIALLVAPHSSEAAFIIKKQLPVAAQTTVLFASATVAENGHEAAATEVIQKKASKPSFFSKLIKATSYLPKAAYIVMAIFFLGWLAMGINDNFSGIEWVLSLILYILLWLPGFIYTLIMMKKYYK